MPTYSTLIKLTHQGITSIKEGPARLDAGKEQLKVFGSELKAFYLTMGRYDIVAISEAPTTPPPRSGNVSTETVRAFTEDEYREIVSALP
jgi:uncharacterized protein with GYD domain